MSQLTDFAENKFVDAYLRAQSLGAPATQYHALFTAAPGETGGGTEASYTNYARVAVTASLANWAGTQSAGSTSASSGTGGVSSNNASIAFPAPGSGPQTLTHFGMLDASSGGNLWHYGTLTNARTVNNGDAAPTFAAAALTVTVA